MKSNSENLQRAMDLISSESDLVEFTKEIPYGLVVEQGERKSIVEISRQKTFFVLTIGEDLNPWAILPALERAKVSVLEEMSFVQPYEDHNMNELVWLYSFSKAKNRFPEMSFNQLCGHVQSMWLKIANLIIDGALSELAPLYAICFEEYGHPLKDKLKKYIDIQASNAWNEAIKSERYADFMRKSGFGNSVASNPDFMKLAKPRKRTIVHKSFGRVHGIMATDKGDFAKPEAELKRLAFWCSENPLMFADHDLDRPIGLIYNPHFCKSQNGSEVRYSTLITNEEQWNNRHRYKGSSLGVYHE